MENGKFVAGYSEPTGYYRFNSESPEVKEYMEGPRKWATFFDRQLALNLKQAPGDIHSEIYKNLDFYKHEWADRYLDSTAKKSRKLAYHDLNAEQSVNELNFHIMNTEFMPLWRRLLLPEMQAALSADQIENIQTRLAMRGAQLALARKVISERASIDGLYSTLPGCINGQLTEIDFSIVGLEILKDHSFEDKPHLLFVPAPPQFESARKNKALSADFIFMDTELQVSRGIQVKTSIDYFKENNSRQYDGDFVTLIDGMVDLGNSKAAGFKYDNYSAIPEPGLIALNFLKFDLSIHKSGRNPALRGDIGAIIRAKDTAKKLSDNKSSFLTQAKKNVQGRILHDLYKN